MRQIILLTTCLGFTGGAGAQSVPQRITPQVKQYLQYKLQRMSSGFQCSGEYTFTVTPKPAASTVENLMDAFVKKLNDDFQQAALQALENGHAVNMKQNYSYMPDDRGFTMHLIYPDKHYGLYVENLGAKYTAYSCKLK